MQDRISPFNINTTSIRQVMRIKKKFEDFVVDPVSNSESSHHKNCMTDRSKGITNEILSIEGLRGVGFQASNKKYINFLLHNLKVQCPPPPYFKSNFFGLI